MSRYNKGEGDFLKTKEVVVVFLIENGFEILTRNSGNVVFDDYGYALKN